MGEQVTAVPRRGATKRNEVWDSYLLGVLEVSGNASNSEAYAQPGKNHQELGLGGGRGGGIFYDSIYLGTKGTLLPDILTLSPTLTTSTNCSNPSYTEVTDTPASGPTYRQRNDQGFRRCSFSEWPLNSKQEPKLNPKPEAKKIQKPRQ